MTVDLFAIPEKEIQCRLFIVLTTLIILLLYDDYLVPHNFVGTCSCLARNATHECSVI